MDGYDVILEERTSGLTFRRAASAAAGEKSALGGIPVIFDGIFSPARESSRDLGPLITELQVGQDQEPIFVLAPRVLLPFVKDKINEDNREFLIVFVVVLWFKTPRTATLKESLLSLSLSLERERKRER